MFGNELLKLDEDKAVQADVRLSYRHKNRTRVEKATTSFFVYRPGAINWDDTRAAAAFVTPSDPVVDGFARAVVQGRDQAFEGGPLRNVMTAMRLFNALSGYGITYVPDPNTPFSSVSDTKSAVDQVQYPRGLLASRTGDCDDMSVLYCTVLENVGIPTAFLDGPGHILMMFDSGLHPRNALALSVDEDLYVVDGERVWIPVETTMIGKSFLDGVVRGRGDLPALEVGGGLPRHADRGRVGRVHPVAARDAGAERDAAVGRGDRQAVRGRPRLAQGVAGRVPQAEVPRAARLAAEELARRGAGEPARDGPRARRPRARGGGDLGFAARRPTRRTRPRSTTAATSRCSRAVPPTRRSTTTARARSRRTRARS